MRSVDVVQASAWYPPYDVGGTEVYLHGLVAGLTARGIRTGVIVPRHAAAPETYAHDGTPVETYPVNGEPKADKIKRGFPHEGFDQFRARLAAHAGAIYHQHSWTRGCGPHHLRAARELGFRTVLTVHVPGNVCLRGTMLLHGSQSCDGLVTAHRCGACWAESRGLPRVLAHAIADAPTPVAAAMRAGRSRISTALSARALGAERKAALKEMIEHADRVVAVCQWLFEALAINGAPREKLVLSRQGVSPEFAQAASAVQRCSQPGGPLKLLFLGRFSKVKGVDIIVRAVRRLPTDVDVHLAIHAISTRDEATYEAEVRDLAAGDARIVFEPPVGRDRLGELMITHDVLVVPSQWLETGPLVVLEAQAMGLFVLGSRLGGIAELVEEGHSGDLVEAGSVAAWSAAMAGLASQRRENRPPRLPRAVRTMDAAASEMAEVYRELGLVEPTS